MVELGIFTTVCCIAIVACIVFSILFYRSKKREIFLEEQIGNLAYEIITMKKIIEDTRKNGR